MNFDDIQMLDVPAESSSHTESLNSDDVPTSPKADKKYPSLSEWLQLDDDLKFQFDLQEYKKSLEPQDPFYRAHHEYISLLYKIVEELLNHDVQVLPEDSEDEEPLGVVTSLREISKNAKKEVKLTRIHDAFSKILSKYEQFLDTVKDELQEEDWDAYVDLHFLLEFIQADKFSIDQRQKPELILYWVNKYDPKPEDSFVDEVVYNNPEPYMHPEFWTTYMGTLLTRGMFSHAARSIKLSKYENLGEESLLYNIIIDFHVLIDSYTSMALKGQFGEWKRTACEMRDSYLTLKRGIEDEKQLVIARQILELLRAITGLPKTLAGFTSTWYELYAALALFQVRDYENVYMDYYQIAVGEKGIDETSDLEVFLSNVVMGNSVSVILAVDIYDSATAAYLSRLFELKGLFLPYYDVALNMTLSNKEGLPRRKISDYLLTRHAFECFEVHPLANVGIGLFLHPVITPSPDHNWKNRQIVGEFLPHYKCYTNDDMEWALTVCAKLNLPDVAKKLYLQQGEQSLAEGHLYEAMNMFVHCYDDTSSSKESALAMEKIHHIVWDILFQDALLNSLPVEDELLNNVITKKVDTSFEVQPAIRQCIAPYSVLVEYLVSLEDKNAFKKNISRLFHLIRFKFMPKKFLPLLFAQFLPLLSSDKFELSDLVVMIELIDSFEVLAQEEPDEVAKLYSFAVKSVDDVPAEHDWRKILQKEGLIPESVEDLVLTLRRSIASKIGDVYIQQK